MVATLTFVMLPTVEGLQGRQELAKTTLKPLEELAKVILRNQVIEGILLMINILMSFILIEYLEIIQRNLYRMLKSISKLQ